MAEKTLITPDFRGAYVQVMRAKAQKQEDGTMGAAKFSIRAAFPPDADLSGLKAAAGQAATDKWGDKVPKTIRSPFRLNEELDNPVVGLDDDWTIMTFSAPETSRPGVVDNKNQDIIDETEVYSGAWYIAQVNAYAYDRAGNKGVTFGLLNVRKQKDDEPLGSGKQKASKAFEAFAPAPSKTAGGMFD